MEKFITRSMEPSSFPSSSGSTSAVPDVVHQSMESGQHAGNDREARLEADHIILGRQLELFQSELFSRSAGSSGGLSRYYISNVIVPRTRKECLDALQELLSSVHRHSGEFALISDHGDHIHVLHDCAYSNRSCRCTWYQTLECRIRWAVPKIRKAELIKCLQRSDWDNIIQYYTTGGRHCKYFKFRGIERRIPMGIENLENRGPKWSQAPGQMAQSIHERRWNLQREFSYCEQTPESDIGPPSLPSRKRRADETDDQIQLMMYRYPTSPLKNVVDTMEWIEDKIVGNVRADNFLFKNHFDRYTKKLCSYSLKEFKEYYADPDVSPKFGSGYMGIDSVYYDIDYSFNMMQEMLAFQFNNDEFLIIDFVFNLWKVLERYQPKLNTLLIHGPPSSGKNFFIDPFLDYLLVKGQLGNPNKMNQFAYQECFGKRVMLWNEPNYEGCQVDTLKMLLGGDSTAVRVKMKDDAAVYRTPFIILTNNLLGIMNDPAFKDRIVQYKWKQNGSLKEYNRKPHPMCIEKVFEKYVPTYYL